MTSSSSVVFKGTQAHFHILLWFWEDAISLCWNLTMHTQGFLTNSSGTESSKHNVLHCTDIKITFESIWHTPSKDFGTPAPHPACLSHPGAPARPLDNIHAQKSLATGDTETGRAAERAEHRAPAFTAIPSPAPTAQVSTSCWVLWSCRRNPDLHFPYPAQCPNPWAAQLLAAFPFQLDRGSYPELSRHL